MWENVTSDCRHLDDDHTFLGVRQCYPQMRWWRFSSDFMLRWIPFSGLLSLLSLWCHSDVTSSSFSQVSFSFYSLLVVFFPSPILFYFLPCLPWNLSDLKTEKEIKRNGYLLRWFSAMNWATVSPSLLNQFPFLQLLNQFPFLQLKEEAVFTILSWKDK